MFATVFLGGMNHSEMGMGVQVSSSGNARERNLQMQHKQQELMARVQQEHAKQEGPRDSPGPGHGSEPPTPQGHGGSYF